MVMDKYSITPVTKCDKAILARHNQSLQHQPSTRITRHLIKRGQDCHQKPHLTTLAAKFLINWLTGKLTVVA